MDVTFRPSCSWDLTPEQKLAVGVIEDALDEIRQRGIHAKSAAEFLCDKDELGFWIAIAGIESTRVVEILRKIGMSYFDRSLAKDRDVRLWKKANPRKTTITDGEPMFTFSDGSRVSKLDLVEEFGLAQAVLEKRFRAYPLIPVELLVLPGWQWQLIDKEQYKGGTIDVLPMLNNEKSIYVG